MPDPQYKTYQYIFGNRGLVARYAVDRAPDHAYLNLLNCDVRRENAISTRYGRNANTVDDGGTVNVPLITSSIHTLGRLNSLGGAHYRYAVAGTHIYRGQRTDDSHGWYTTISGTLNTSGSRCSILTFGTEFSSYPYAYFADYHLMVKDNGSFSTVQQWGIYPPSIPISQSIGITSYQIIDLCDSTTDFVEEYVLNILLVNTTMGTIVTGGAVSTVTPVSMAAIMPGMVLSIGGAAPETVIVLTTTSTSFTAFFQNSHIAADTITDSAIVASLFPGLTLTVTKIGAVDLSQLTQGGTTVAAADTDNFSMFLGVSIPANVTAVSLTFDVGDTSFTDVYQISIDPVLIQNAMQQLKFSRSAFTGIGQAGMPGKTWANVSAYQFKITVSDAGAVNFDFNDIVLFGGGGVDSTGGVAYDYRYTYYNNNTGAESNPSQPLITSQWLTVTRQTIVVTWTASPDPQVTHVRLYRRGGTLGDNWRQVAQVPIGITTFSDTIPDSFLASAKILEEDNDVPVTSTLPVPVNTTLGTSVTAGSLQTVTPASIANIFAHQLVTIGTGTIGTSTAGATQEQVWVDAVAGATFTAFFQNAHGASETITAETKPGQGMPLGAVAFNQIFLAGDPNNPHLLYYSKTSRPESFSPANFLEIGTPSDPIMGLVETRGQVYIFTTSTVYQVIVGGSIPTVLKTGVRHGLAASFALAPTEGAIWYMSHDGIYEFTGGSSKLMSENVQWLFDGTNLGPVLGLQAANISDALMAFCRNEIYVSYVDTNGVRRRLIWSMVYNRWRNDDQPANAMLLEEDTHALLIARTNGMIYTDRVFVNDFDGEGYSSGGGYSGNQLVQQPIPFTLQTESQDQGEPKRTKVYNELTLDINTSGQDVTVNLLFDQGTTTLNVGTVNTTNRKQVQFNINAGLGQFSRDVALQLSGSVTAVVDMYEVHFRAAFEAEFRQSFDSYLIKYGTDEYKVIKQGWFEYAGTSAITFSCYLDGSTTAEFGFTLAPSVTRTAKLVRFPALKAKIFRWTATSTADFQLYDESAIEVKPINNSKGYAKARLATGVV